MIRKGHEVCDRVIERLREDVESAESDGKYAAVTAFLFGLLVGVIAAAALIYGF